MKNNIDFFIVGYPRSGTTLLASLLSRHSEIYIPAETHFFRSFLHNSKNANTPDQLYTKFITDSRLKDLDIPNANLKGIIKKYFPNRPAILSSVLHHIALNNNKNIIGEKTPGHILFYRDIIEAYPNTKFIYIMRDGRDCVFSNIKEKWTFSNPKKHAAEWNYYINHYTELSKLAPKNTLLIRYEDLIENPDKVLKKINGFIGLKYEIEQITSETSTDVVPEWEKKWKEKAGSLPDKNNKYKWKSYEDKKMLLNITLIMNKNLKQFNYEGFTDISPGSILIFGNIRNFIYLSGVYPYMKLIAASRTYKIIKNKLANQ